MRAPWLPLLLALAPLPVRAAGQPDLVPTALDHEPATLQIGTNATYTVTVKNQGPADATSTFYVTWYVDGSKCDDTSVSGGLDAGQTVEASTNDSNCQPDGEGAHDVEAVIDSDKSVAESNEGNNSLKKEWKWLPEPLPDLVVSDLIVKPDAPFVGDPVEIQAVLYNQGTADADKAFYVAFYLDQVRCDEQKMSFGLKEDTEYRMYVTEGACLPATPGEHRFEVELDRYGSVTESDEDNNRPTWYLKWYAKTGPDLAIQELSVGLEEPCPITATIRNDGTDAAPVGFDVAFLVDDAWCDQATVDAPLDPGASVTMTAAAACRPATGGNHAVRAVIDPTAAVDELDETNNEADGTFAFLDPPVAPDEPAAGDEPGGTDAAPGDDVPAGTDGTAAGDGTGPGADGATAGDGAGGTDASTAGDGAGSEPGAQIPMPGEDAVRTPVVPASRGGCAAGPGPVAVPWLVLVPILRRRRL